MKTNPSVRNSSSCSVPIFRNEPKRRPYFLVVPVPPSLIRERDANGAYAGDSSHGCLRAVLKPAIEIETVELLSIRDTSHAIFGRGGSTNVIFLRTSQLIGEDNE
jgi:hypothetical protein